MRFRKLDMNPADNAGVLDAAPGIAAKVYAFLVSDETACITGQTYNVYGGLQLN